MSDPAFFNKIVGVASACVYCRSTDGLSDEHIIPYGLNGHWVLKTASSKRCRDITNSFETEVLRKQFLLARSVLGIRTRRRKERPKTFPLLVGGRGVVEVPITEHHPFMVWQVFGAPTEYESLAPRSGITVRDVQFLIGGMRLADLNRKFGAGNWGIELDFNALALPRLVGKIAHCFATVAFGGDGFTSQVCDAVMNDPSQIGRWIGSLPGNPVNDSSGLHAVKLEVDNASGSIVAFVRLFAQYEAPEYVALVGRLTDAGAAHQERAASFLVE